MGNTLLSPDEYEKINDLKMEDTYNHTARLFEQFSALFVNTYHKCYNTIFYANKYKDQYKTNKLKLDLAQGDAFSFKEQLLTAENRILGLEKEKYFTEQDAKSNRAVLERERSGKKEAVKAAREAESSKLDKERERAEAAKKLVAEEKKKKKDKTISKLNDMELKVAKLIVERDAAYEEMTFAFLFTTWLKHLGMDFSFLGDEYAMQIAK